MPVSPKDLIERAGYRLTGSVPWGTRPRSSNGGVYVVSLSADAGSSAGLSSAPVSTAKVAAWIARLPAFQLDGQPTPLPDAVIARLVSFWLPDESILYIGKATSLANRVGQYFRTPLGDRSPHAGGHWIKTLDVLERTTIHYADVLDAAPDAVEAQMMGVFRDSVSPESMARHPQPALMIPFANLEGPGGRRAHGLAGTKLS